MMGLSDWKKQNRDQKSRGASQKLLVSEDLEVTNYRVHLHDIGYLFSLYDIHINKTIDLKVKNLALGDHILARKFCLDFLIAHSDLH